MTTALMITRKNQNRLRSSIPFRVSIGHNVGSITISQHVAIVSLVLRYKETDDYGSKYGAYPTKWL